MNIWFSVLIAVQILSALGVILLVLLQHGKGADMGAAFGSGASGSLFGATGSANFLSRATAWLAGAFFACTLGLALFSSQQRAIGSGGSGSVMERVEPGKGGDTPAPPPDAASQIPGAAGAPSNAPSAPSAPANPAGAPAIPQPGAPSAQPGAAAPPEPAAAPAQSAPATENPK